MPEVVPRERPAYSLQRLYGPEIHRLRHEMQRFCDEYGVTPPDAPVITEAPRDE